MRIKIPNEENKYIVLGLLSVLIILWLILYVIPNFFILLFHTFLGNLILILCVFLLSFKNIKYSIGLLILFIILYQFSNVSKTKERFIQAPQEHAEVINNKENIKRWSDETIKDLIVFENTVNSQIYTDLNIVQSQASEEEARYLLKNGKWPWSQEVKQLYMDSVSINPYIRNMPEDSLNTAMTIYNQTAILQVLRTQTKEGRFLLSGITFDSNPSAHTENTYGYKSGLVSKNDTVIKCENKKDDFSLTKIEYIGDSKGITANHQFKKSKLDYKTLESEVPGFHFINGPCDPCIAFNSPADYSCPFKLEIDPNLISQKNDEPSSVWKYLWGIE